MTRVARRAGGARREAAARSRRAAQPVRRPEPAQARRAAEREGEGRRGLKELDLWLRDLVRRGLAAAQGEPAAFWETPAARMVDAQAPGVARLLREMAGLPASGEGWQERLLERLAACTCSARATGARDAAGGDPGRPPRPDRLDAEPGGAAGAAGCPRPVAACSASAWRRRSGCASSAPGSGAGEPDGPRCSLQFAHGSQPLDAEPVARRPAIEAELVFYPGAYPLRALLKTWRAPPEPLDAMPGYATLAARIGAYAAALAADPWLEELPAAAGGRVP